MLKYKILKVKYSNMPSSLKKESKVQIDLNEV